jgi:tetratricopeptide (TPR) repeat protein
MIADLTSAIAVAESNDWHLRFERAVAVDAANDLGRAGEDLVPFVAKFDGDPARRQLAAAFARAVRLRHDRGIAPIVTRLDAAQLLSVARELDKDKPVPEADAYAEAAVLFAPDDVEILLGCVDIETRGDGFAAAEKHVLRALELAPEKGTVWFERGVFLERSKDYAGAVEAYTKSLSLGPTASGYARRALMRSMVGDDTGALADYGEAIALYPRRAIWYRLRADILEKRGDLAGAEADRKRAAEIDAGR